MKLILKIAAGIIVAWVLILVTGFLIAVGTTKVITGAVVEPTVEELTKPFEELTTGLTLNPPPTQTESTELLDIGYDDCKAQGGFPGWSYKEGVSNCLVKP